MLRAFFYFIRNNQWNEANRLILLSIENYGSHLDKGQPPLLLSEGTAYLRQVELVSVSKFNNRPEKKIDAFIVTFCLSHSKSLNYFYLTSI